MRVGCVRWAEAWDKPWVSKQDSKGGNGCRIQPKDQKTPLRRYSSPSRKEDLKPRSAFSPKSFGVNRQSILQLNFGWAFMCSAPALKRKVQGSQVASSLLKLNCSGKLV